jgi:Holliday junction resolvase RusA-like endonuclease
VNVVAFTVHGAPAPAGSKRGFYNKHTGRVVITDANEKKARPWKALIHDAALQAMVFDGDGTNGYMPPLEGPVMIEIKFWMPRPKHHFGSGRNAGVLKSSAPRFHTSAPDALKLARGVEDALQGLVYRNDSQIAVELLEKVYGEPARCDVRVVQIAQDTVEVKHRELHEATESAPPVQLPIEAALTKEAAA